jgi:CBS domain-containing protein
VSVVLENAKSEAQHCRCPRAEKGSPQAAQIWGKVEAAGMCGAPNRSAGMMFPALEAHMQVKDILRDKGREVISINSEATLSEAARLLASKRIGALVVRERDGSLAGILSERDIVRAVALASVNALPQAVSQHMTRAVATCCEADSVDALMEMMTRGRFRHMPVVEDDRIAGLVSIGDVVKTRISETVMEAQSLREYIAAG